MALSDVKVRTAKPEAKVYKLTDGEGVVLLVHPNHEICLYPLKQSSHLGVLKSLPVYTAYYHDYALCRSERLNRLQPRARDCWRGCYG